MGSLSRIVPNDTDSLPENVRKIMDHLAAAAGIGIRVLEVQHPFELPPTDEPVCLNARDRSDAAIECLKFHRGLLRESAGTEGRRSAVCRNGFLSTIVNIPREGRARLRIEIGPLADRGAGREPALQLLDLLLEQIAVDSASGGSTPAGLLPEPVQKARTFALQHFDQPVTLADAARAAGLSKDRLGRLFRQHEGVTFARFLNHQRTRLACEQLIDQPHARVSEIAFACGFSSIPHFNKLFRQLTGMSPSDYRIRSSAQARP